LTALTAASSCPLQSQRGANIAAGGGPRQKIARHDPQLVESEGLGRRLGGKWCVSKVALEMYLDGKADALERYLQGDRLTPDVVSYFKRFGLLAQKPVNARFG
jgi:hypothetical protein